MAVQSISTCPAILARVALAVADVFNVKNVYLDEYVFVQYRIHVTTMNNTMVRILRFIAAFYLKLFMWCSLRFRMRVSGVETIYSVARPSLRVTRILIYIFVSNESGIIGV